MNDMIQAIARAMLAALFIVSGFGKLMAVGGIAATLGRQGFPQPMLFGYAVGTLEFVGGILILIGFQTRIVALVMAAFTLGTILISHNFWAMEGAARAGNQTQALKNIGIVGGFLLLFVAGPGRLSVDGRRR